MDNSAAKLEKSEFDWDQIIVGDFNLDHSENFFDTATKENKPIVKEYINEKNISNASHNIVPLDWDAAAHTPVKLELFSHDDSPTMSAHQITQQIKQENIIKECNDSEADDKSCETTNVQAPVNLKLQWSFAVPQQKVGNGNWQSNGTDNDALAPKAYAFKDVYQQKREQALRKQAEEERKARQFQSRPMPNFKAHHRRLQETLVLHKITVPTTPDTVKHWAASMERRKLRELQMNHIAQQQEAKNHRGRKLQLHDAEEVDSKPFQLHTEQRMRERREYDAAVQCNLEQKKKEEEQRIKRELEEVKQIRKMTEFKARPNPFK